MTKDWDAVQDEIKELSFNQKKPLEEVKALMERKYKFRASTRAYRMKLKEWGLMRHKAKRATKDRGEAREGSQSGREESDQRDQDPGATVEPMSVENNNSATCEKNRVWEAVDNADTDAEPTFMGLLTRPRDLQPSVTDPWSQARTMASRIVLDMLAAVLDNDSQGLEKLVLENVNHVNDPIGLPFDSPNSRFYGHPARAQMIILEHADQTLLDIACGMPCGPIIWVLLSHGARSSKHPIGIDLALHNAGKNGRLYTVQALLFPGRSNVNGLPESTWRPLVQAVYWNVPDIVRILVSRGANIDDAGPSPLSLEPHTALQVCLEKRATSNIIPSAKDNCNETLKILLDAGANIHVPPAKGSTETPFEVFIRPWQGVPYWTVGLTETELDCLQSFVSKGANLQAHLEGYPCASSSSTTFKHQVLWHSSPSVARLLVDSFVVSSHNNGSSLLHEILVSCPDAKQHPVDTLRDLELLLQTGVDPNLADINGDTPLEKCIKLCPAVDLVVRLQLLLEHGADPELEDIHGVQPYVSAKRAFEEPFRDEVMQALVSKIRGQYVRHVDGISHTWAEGFFPISETQSYEQVLSCARQTGDFALSMRHMVPEDVQEAFQRAYFAVVSNNFLDTMTRVAKSKMLDTKEKQEIVWIISMRKDIDLPAYRFDQELVVALLDPQIPCITPAEVSTASTLPQDSTSSVVPSPVLSLTTTGNTTSPPVHAPFQFNPNSTTPPDQVIPTSQSPQPVAPGSDDFFITATTQIRWKDPCAKPRPDDVAKGKAGLLQYKCPVCGGGTLLTKKELDKHTVEHAHSKTCAEGGCKRRFCVARLTCRNQLFAGGIAL